MRAQTFSIGASMTLEILTFGTQSSLDARQENNAAPRRALINASRSLIEESEKWSFAACRYPKTGSHF
jgi:hypothetical protein